jgi:hypothetical protein
MKKHASIEIFNNRIVDAFVVWFMIIKRIQIVKKAKGISK